MSNERVCGTLIHVSPIANQPLSMIYNSRQNQYYRARSAHTPAKGNPSEHRNRQPSSSEREFPKRYTLDIEYSL